ncbi:porin-like protein [Rhodopseudomonas faecalis]|uniref:Porin n=1 Tax=Rhodopseudomonas faecalis TaxID=99655 RepID=A0A318TKR8_9BRAD|nr:porin [Rhodopseudomonas faecalis]PYF05336.1 porin-like protein [Rhodopseudomonas faecalis]
MNFVKGLMLGTAATMLATAGAQAADLPLKAKAVEYVKVCSLYGAGFYYIPGTDTCIKLGGYTRAEVAFNASGMTGTPAWSGAAGQDNRLKNDYIFRTRQSVNLDTRTATEYGVVRTYFDAVFTWTSGSSTSTIAGGDVGVFFAFVQFAGFTFGKAVSQFSAPWNGTPGNITSNLLGGDDTSTGINQISYTAQFGNGVSAAISLEDQSRYRQSQLFNVNGVGAAYAGDAASYLAGLGSGVNNYAGVQVPDIVGQVRVDQAWGLFQVAAAAHQVRASYYVPTDESTGHPGDKWGYAVMAALSLKNLPTGAGDSINVDAVYADGASRYVIGGTTVNTFSMFGGSGLAYQSVGFGAAADGIFATNGGIETTKAWGIRGAFNHNWNQNWATSIFGSYSSLEYSSQGKAWYTQALQSKVGTGVVGSPDFNIIQIGTRTAWTPVKNLTFTGEVMWTKLDQNYSGVTTAVNAGGTKPTGQTYELKDQDTWSGVIRAQRNF